MSEVSKFRCMVYGCTVPAGIFHEHPTDAPVIRDPAAPLNAFERDELNAYRRMGRIQSYAEEQQKLAQHRALLQAQAMQNSWPYGSAQQHWGGLGQNTQLNAEEQRMRNHRDAALLHVAAMTPPVYVVPAGAPMVPGRKLTQALLEAGRIRRETADLGVVFNEAPAPRRSFVSTTARIAFWIVLAVTVAIWIFAGVKS